MARASKEVDAYLAALPEDRCADLAAVRKLIRKTLPKAVESMAYRMPTFEVGGEQILALASQKNYMALYTCETGALDKHRDAFKHLNCGRSCLRFKSLGDLDMKAVEHLIKDAGNVRR